VILGDWSLAEIADRLAGAGVPVKTGPFSCLISSSVPELAPEFARLYRHHPLEEGGFFDFHVRVAPGEGIRRWFRHQARFVVDGVEPFTPLPRNQALPMLEWGLNWCITAYSHHVLIMHAATVAKGDRALIMPAPPGSGKSTLCAALVNRGWRLLSDELTIIRLDTGQITGLARPVNLKNYSIDLIRGFAPEAYVTRPVLDTAKGTVALMAPSLESVQQMSVPASPRWVVLPRYKAGAPATLTPLPTGAAFLQLAENAMNYHVLGAKGFLAVGGLVDSCRHFSFEYGHLDDAIACFERLAAGE